MRIGIFIPNWVGDTVMSTPTLRALKEHYGPDAQMVGIMQPVAAQVLAGTNLLDEQVLYDRKSRDPAQRTWAVLDNLRDSGLDTIVLLTNSLRGGLMAWASGARQRVGYVRNGRGPLLTHKLYYPRLGRKRLPAPTIDAYLQLAYALGCEPREPRLELATLPVDEAAADDVWNKFRLPAGERVVVINSSGAYGAAKLWPTEYCAHLARRIVVEQGLSVLVACGPNERDAARRIAQLAGHARVVSLADESLTIGLTKACIRRSRLLVSTDSGPRFFGVAFGRRVVTLFGPTHQDWSRSHYAGEICLQQPLSCSPCSRRVCPLGHHDCMRLLSVERVYQAVAAQLGGERTVQAA